MKEILRDQLLSQHIEKVIPFSEKYLHFQIPQVSEKVRVHGKFFTVGGEKFIMKGVTYGAFQPDKEGREYHDLEQIRKDFKMMAHHGFNTVRIPHTTPPPILLDLAAEEGLRVMIGLSAEQMVGYLIDKKKVPGLRKYIWQKLEHIAGHPALLCIAIGNEIPASIVRWLGRKKIERYLRTVYQMVKEIDSDTPVTYVNYPTTEYLDLRFLDLLCFNVYLENPAAFSSYIYKLQNMAGERPLIMGEIGLDCMRNSESIQLSFLRWQLPMAFGLGCAGVCIFSWTDEWFRGGEEVHDWAFGLTTKDRVPKPALQMLPMLMRNLPFDLSIEWPMVSVVICTYNGAKTIRKTLDTLCKQTYPNTEVIVVNDGSTDDTLRILSDYQIRIITTENKGLSHARNLGMHLAEGNIIAYLDDDAYPDPDWLWYIAYAFQQNDIVGVGGPNLLPDGSNFIAACVDHTPGTPTHILLNDLEAEHIPGCNMAFRKDRLLAVGGFDARYRVAGDDVDLCWRLQEAGGTIGYAAGAVTWHYRRDSIKRFWKQQAGYGKAEALLEQKWPDRFNAMGQLAWEGRIYGNGSLNIAFFRQFRIYHGTWGMAPFQSIYQSMPSTWLSMTLMPEWYLVTTITFLIGLLGIVWTPFFAFTLLSVLAGALPLVQIIHKVRNIERREVKCVQSDSYGMFLFTTTLLHALQPIARLWGRIQFGLTPWRRIGSPGFAMPVTQHINKWCENWVAPQERLLSIESFLLQRNHLVQRGGDYDAWDLHVKGGALGMASIAMAAEDHKQGHQYLRFRLVPRVCKRARWMLYIFGMLAMAAWSNHAVMPAMLLAFVTFAILLRSLVDASRAMHWLKQSLKGQHELKIS